MMLSKQKIQLPTNYYGLHAWVDKIIMHSLTVKNE